MKEAGSSSAMDGYWFTNEVILELVSSPMRGVKFIGEFLFAIHRARHCIDLSVKTIVFLKCLSHFKGGSH